MHNIKQRLIVIAVIIGLLAFTAWWLLLRPAPVYPSQDPIATFNHGSIGNEAQNGLPYWIWRVLPSIFPDYLPGKQDGYSALGFFWESGSELPVGFSKRSLGVIPRVAFNCALCHQGSYRLVGQQKSTLVPGGPGTRVQPQNYQRFLMQAGQDARFNADRIMTEINKIYAMPHWEKLLYRFLLIPLTKRALNSTAQDFAWMAGKPDWGIGRIDPFNPVKFGILELPVDNTVGNSDMMPLWELDQVVKRKDKVYALHWDGLNTDLHEVAVSGAIGDGMTYQSYAGVKANLESIENWIRVQQAPPSPFSIYHHADDPYYLNHQQVERGQQLFQRYCADCHAINGTRFRSVIPAVEIGTDRHRQDMWTIWARDRYMNYQKDSADWQFKHWQKVDGYVATSLSGLWLKGPYLHNGSVPTLNDLLKPVAQRPIAYCRGSDTVDPINGGFLATTDNGNGQAQCQGFYYDTRVAGNGNAGHEYGTQLKPAQKTDLLSYLKTL